MTLRLLKKRVVHTEVFIKKAPTETNLSLALDDHEISHSVCRAVYKINHWISHCGLSKKLKACEIIFYIGSKLIK